MDFDFDKIITVSAPINIALVKYWGKEDEHKIIPKNNSISLTLNKNQLQSTTCVRVSTNLAKNTVLINNKESNVTNRMVTMFKSALNKSCLPVYHHEKLKFKIISSNNFPTSAGLASSASGMAALAFSFGKIFSLSMENVSILARLGSGSATRSVYGGIVEWVRNLGDESRAVQLYDENYWPELQVMICIVNGSEKKISSTSGMQATVNTSQLSKYRFDSCVDKNLIEMRKSLATKNFSQLAEITMRESNQLHAICLDTTPPNVYLNAASFDIMEFVNTVNEVCKETKLAYTFDAGPNAFLIFEKNSEALLHRLLDFSFNTELENHQETQSLNVDDKSVQILFKKLPRSPGIIKYVISTKIGSGPDEIYDCKK